MNSPENCRDTWERRRRIREAARRAGSNEPNGIDYVEVDEGQTVITIYFLNKAPHGVGPENVRIEGGVRVRDIRVVAVTLCEVEDEARDDCMRVVVDKYGDFSTYTLRLVEAVEGRPGTLPLAGFDPRYAQIDFSFKANCPSDFDCAPAADCPAEPTTEPEIDYLAKDYASFQRLIYDRLSLVMPDWRERHAPDIGVALVELFAYVGDYLSYFQDGVATEAYLETARRRISVRRHARLVDYLMHEGCNARAWVTFEVDGDATIESTKDFYFVTGRGGSYGAGGRVISEDDLRGVAPSDYEVFEPLTAGWRGEAFRLRKAHSRISFYTWGDRECCLPRGTTSATLRDEWLGGVEPGEQYEQQQQGGVSAEGSNEGPEQQQRAAEARARERALSLSAGDVLIFEEVLGPLTGAAPDADRTHRHAVRLTRVEPRVDELYDQPVVEIEWAQEDALPFALCLSAIGRAPECLYLEDVSVARGNVLLVDHGRTTGPEEWTVPEAEELPAGCFAAFDPRETIERARRFRPTLKHGNVTHRAPFPAPSVMRAGQVRLLGRLLEDVRARVEWLWKRTRAGRPLAAEEVSELTIIFGRATLVRAGVVVASGTKEKQKQQQQQQPTPTPAEQAEGLAKLLARFDDYLRKKARRVRFLRERVLGGYVLARAEREELKSLFGARFVEGLEPSSAITYGPASIALKQEPREALAAVKVRKSRRQPVAEGAEGEEPAFLSNHYPRWWPAFDLLGGDRRRFFVAEIDDEGRAHLRFGEGEAGRAPEPGMKLGATYRVGNGAAGNVGPEAISHLVMRRRIDPGINVSRVRNPLPASGGVEPEPVEEVRVFAPGAFRKELRRAITPEDYGTLAGRDSAGRVQRAAGSLRWGGSWQVMRTAVDARGAAEADAALLAEVEGSLHRYRRIGHDLSTRAARYVPLDILIEVCVLPHYLRGHVRAALRDVFGSRDLAGGRRGFFHPDNLSFGEAIHLSRLVAAAQEVEGVESVTVKRLQRLDEGPRGELEEGLLPLGPLEVARLDNDPNFPEHGRLVLEVRGGR
ncbi:MAG TPA: putative baseplate assembly protein [Pyrinomonadaceae bacterium]|nr:putative baseplate assembly protein [Pyrinomonadaceae bacterium]